MLPALLLLAAAAPHRAPLPPLVVSDGRKPGDNDYRPIADLTGLYAHGRTGVGWNVEFEGPPCSGSEAERAALLDRQGGAAGEFWLYATSAQGVLLRRDAEIDPKRPCAAALSWTVRVERAFVADGWIHQLEQREGGSLEPVGSWPADDSVGEYADDFRTLQSLMARVRRFDRPRTGTQDVAGVRAECHGFGGLVWATTCYAAGGPLKGTLLRAAAGDDERPLFSLSVDELRQDVLLPGQLFEVDRAWSAKD